MKFSFQDQHFMKKQRKNVQGVFSRCRSKMLILEKINIFYPFQHAHLKCKTCLEGCILTIFYRRFPKSKNIGRIMLHSVTIWRNENIASSFAPHNGTYLWSRILLYQWKRKYGPFSVLQISFKVFYKLTNLFILWKWSFVLGWNCKGIIIARSVKALSPWH